MKIVARFIGRNSSLGYVYGQVYSLYLNGSNIKRNNGQNPSDGHCRYATVQAFLKNWEIIAQNGK